MAQTVSHKTAKRGAGKRGEPGARRRAGRIQVRKETAGYRAVAEDQATRIRGEIDAALAGAQRIREEIEARIETRWHGQVESPAAGVKSGGRRRAKP